MEAKILFCKYQRVPRSVKQPHLVSVGAILNLKFKLSFQLRPYLGAEMEICSRSACLSNMLLQAPSHKFIHQPADAHRSPVASESQHLFA